MKQSSSINWQIHHQDLLGTDFGIKQLKSLLSKHPIKNPRFKMKWGFSAILV